MFTNRHKSLDSMNAECILSGDLASPARFKDQLSEMTPLPIASMITMLSPKYQPTLEAVLKLHSVPTSEDAKEQKSLSFTAEDIKLIAAEALRISSEQGLSPTVSDQERNIVSHSQVHPHPHQSTLAPHTINLSSTFRLNKFVRILHDMLVAEAGSGIVEWRRGLLVLHSTDAFARTILPKYFNTRNFKTFRRQLNYYGFVHVRSFSTTGSSTTALWVNRELAQSGTDDIGSVLMLRRVEPTEISKTAEGRRVRKEQAIHTVEDDIGVNQKSLQLEQIRNLAARGVECPSALTMAAPMAARPLDSFHPTHDENASAANLLLLLSRS